MLSEKSIRVRASLEHYKEREEVIHDGKEYTYIFL